MPELREIVTVPFFVELKRAALCINCDCIYDGAETKVCPKCLSKIRKFLLDVLGRLDVQVS